MLAGTALDKDFELAAQPDRDGPAWVQATPRAKDTQIQALRVGFKGKALAAMEIVDAFGQFHDLAESVLAAPVRAEDLVSRAGPAMLALPPALKQAGLTAANGDPVLPEDVVHSFKTLSTNSDSRCSSLAPVSDSGPGQGRIPPVLPQAEGEEAEAERSRPQVPAVQNEGGR